MSPLGRVAAQRQGNVTTQQLLELGLDKYAIRRRVVAGYLYRAIRDPRRHRRLRRHPRHGQTLERRARTSAVLTMAANSSERFVSVTSCSSAAS
jgi:hypothetical protein